MEMSRQFLADLPAWTPNALSAALFVGILLGVWRVPFERVLADAPRARWRDLRLWATALVVIQLALYWVFR